MRHIASYSNCGVTPSLGRQANTTVPHSSSLWRRRQPVAGPLPSLLLRWPSLPARISLQTPHASSSAAAQPAASGPPEKAENATSSSNAPAAATNDKNTKPTQKIDPKRLAWEVLWPDRALAALTAVALVVTVGLTLAFPLAIGDLFDVVRQHLAAVGAPQLSPAAAAERLGLMQTVTEVQRAAAAAPPEFFSVLLRLCACLVLSAAGNAAVAYLAPLLGERFAVRMRKRLMAETLAKDQAFFDGVGKGDLTARLTLDVAVVQATVADFLGARGFRSMLEVICSLAIIAAKNPLLAVVCFVVTPTLSFVLRKIVVNAAKLTYARQSAAARAMEFATDRLTAVRTVQLFAAEDREAAAYGALTQEGFEMARKCATFQGVVEGCGRLAVNVGTLSLLGLGGSLVLAGQISLGALLAANVYNLFLSVGLSSLAGSLGELGKAVGAMERIAEVVGAGERDPAAAASTPFDGSDLSFTGQHEKEAAVSSSGDRGVAVELEDIWFKYAGREDWALKGLSLRIAPGSTLALVGASGAGKSTIAALLLGLYTPERGTVTVDGVALTPVTIPAVRNITGVVLQQPSLLSGSVADQIRLGAPESSDAEVEAAAAAAHAAGFVQALPDGYNTELGERGHSLSGGQQQRLAIARALVRRPRLLLLDEPTAALDVESERAVDDALRVVTGCTTVIIAHRLSTVRRADAIAVVDGGRVVEQGSHKELMAVGGGHYRRMVLTSELVGSNSASDSEEEVAVAEMDKVVLN